MNEGTTQRYNITAFVCTGSSCSSSSFAKKGTPWQAAAKAVREHLLDMGDTELYGPKVDDEEYAETFQVANAAALEKKNTIDAAARQIEAENAAAMVPQGANGNLRQAVREHAGEIAVACAGVIAYWCMYS